MINLQMRHRIPSPRTSWLLLGLAVMLLTSCRSKDLILPGDTLEVAYEKANRFYENEKWSEAVSAFETVVSVGRGTNIGQEAQFLLAESYFNNKRYLQASAEYDRYTTFYSRSDKRQEAEYKSALSLFLMSPRYKLDQSYSLQAMDRFRLFLSRYPDSEFAEYASERIAQIREKLAKKNYMSGQFYMRNGMYEAAAIYYNLVIDQYPESPWAEAALVEQIEAYILFANNSVEARQAERYEMALSSYSRYLQLFPRGDNRSKAENLQDRARDALDELKMAGAGDSGATGSSG
jgi:outer membrane protein assembly factor BamD